MIATGVDDTYVYMNSYNNPGIYDFFLSVTDTVGNLYNSLTSSFSILENPPPRITNSSCVSSDPKDTDEDFGWVNISCNVICNSINVVFVDFTFPDDTNISFQMNEDSSGKYYLNTSLIISLWG